MLSAQMKRGDIVFSYGPPHFELIPTVIKSYQRFQSMFFSTLDQTETDYQKMHVLVCVENSPNGMTVARVSGLTLKYEFNDIREKLARVDASPYEILRPLDEEFANHIALIVADEENKQIVHHYGTWFNILPCCPSSNGERTTRGLSINSNCALFVAEAVQEADPDYRVAQSLNLSTFGLLLALKASGRFESIQVKPELPEIIEAKSKLKTL